jgi:hypothetical protein
MKLFGGQWYKAGGFTVLVELSTVFIQGWESKLALSILILINAGELCTRAGGRQPTSAAQITINHPGPVLSGPMGIISKHRSGNGAADEPGERQ